MVESLHGNFSSTLQNLMWSMQGNGKNANENMQKRGLSGTSFLTQSKPSRMQYSITFQSVEEFLSVKIQRKPIEQYFHSWYCLSLNTL